MGYRIHNLLAATIIAATCLVSCSDIGDCFKGTGDVILEERYVGFFDGITIDDDINLVILSDTVQYLQIEAGENLLPEICTEVSDGMLYLSNNNVCKYSRSYQKEITVKAHVNDIKKLAFAGSARITSENLLSFNDFLIWLDGARGEINLELNTEKLNLEHVSGNGLTILCGEVNEGIVNSKAQGLLNLRDLKINHLKMVSDSYNDAFIWVTDTIDITITNLGNVYCRGNPFIKSYIRTGGGKFIPME
ncbi:MAG: DUF2807 domain-containing protein [Bacteroidales bacterium]|nr:DUF2807 domain-containing protein [Bacteroidales bacterium]